MKTRTYVACYDDGHDFGEFEFYSGHRAGSKANLDDAKATARRKYGHHRAQQIEIYQVYLQN